MAATPCEDSILLTRANKKIADLKEDIRRLSDELLRKDSLLSSFMDVAHGQSKQPASLSAQSLDTQPPVVLGRRGDLRSQEGLERSCLSPPPDPLQPLRGLVRRLSGPPSRCPRCSIGSGPDNSACRHHSFPSTGG